MLGAVDARDTAAFGDHLAEDVVFRFGNAPAVAGAEAVRSATEQFLGGLRGISHSVTEVWEVDDVVAAHGSVTYTRLDGSTLSVPFALIWHLAGGLIHEYRIFVDVSAL